jgi:hypothetical protein
MSVNDYDEVKICTAALTLIGEDPIDTITDPETDVEATCATLLPLVIATLLSKHEWNFANPIRELAVNADEPGKFGYTYAHRLPSDLIAGPFAVYGNNNTRRPTQNYENANDHIYSDFEIIHARYRIKPAITIMPIYFIDLIVTVLGMRLAKPVADNTDLATELRILAFGPAELDGKGGMFADAKNIDAKSQPIRSMFANGDPLSATRY